MTTANEVEEPDPPSLRIAALEEENQHLLAVIDGLERQLEAADSRQHEITWGRLRTLEEHRGAVPRLPYRHIR